MSYKYTYLKNREDFENEMPFEYEEFDEYVEKYPTVYPCVLEFEDYLGHINKTGFHINIIEDLSGFIYKDGFLYKLESDMSNFIYENNSLYKKC